MSEEAHYRKLEHMYHAARCNAYYRPVLRVAAAQATLTLPVREDFFHIAGAVHGAAYFKVMDDAAFFAAQSVVKEAFIVTVSFQVQLLRPVTEGVLRAEGTLVHRSRRLLVAEAAVWDAEARCVGRGSGTFMPSAIALDEKIGYA